MALQLRRGINSQRATTALAAGELVYVTDNLTAHVSPLYIGDGSTTGGVPVVKVISVNTKTGAVVLDTDDIVEGTTNKYYTTERAQDDVASMLVNGVHTGITFTYNPTPQDSGNRIDAVVAASGVVNSGSINRLAYYGATGTTLSNTESLTWSDASNSLTIDSGVFNLTAGNGPRSMMNVTTFNNVSTANSININKARGSAIAPTTVLSGDYLSDLNFNGYDGDQFITAARISARASDVVSNNIVPSLLVFYVTGADGALRAPMKLLSTGQLILGPSDGTETGTGTLRILSTTNGADGAINQSSISASTFFNGQDGQNISLTRARGTRAAPTPIVSGDDIFDINYVGYDGANYSTAVQLTATVDNAVSTNIIPGALNVSVRNTSGTLTPVMKVYNNTGTGNGKLDVSGIVNASVAIKTGVFADNTARNSAIPEPSVGMIVFNSGTGKFEGNTDGSQSGWVALN
jgi:hypothetical protein